MNWPVIHLCPLGVNCLRLPKPTPKIRRGKSVKELSLQLLLVNTELALALTPEASLSERRARPVHHWLWWNGIWAPLHCHLVMWTTTVLLVGPGWFSWMQPNPLGIKKTLHGQCLLCLLACSREKTAVCLCAVGAKTKSWLTGLVMLFHCVNHCGLQHRCLRQLEWDFLGKWKTHIFVGYRIWHIYINTESFGRRFYLKWLTREV